MHKIKFLVLFLLMFFIPLTSQAFDFSNQQAFKDVPNFTLEKDQVVKENLWRTGKDITIDGIVQGDAFLIASDNITITGEVQGDVFSISKNLNLEGEVQGSLRSLASEKMNISGTVQENVLSVSAEKFKLNQLGVIGQDVNILSKNTQVHGQINRNLTAKTQKLNIDNTINGDVKVSLLDAAQKDAVSFSKNSLVKGDFKYKHDQELNFNQTKIEGNIDYTKTEEPQDFSLISTLIKIFSLIIIGLVLVALLKTHLNKLAVIDYTNWYKKLGIGAIILILSPIIILLLAFTLIGTPLALIWLILLGVALYTFQLITATAIGYEIIKLVKPKYSTRNYNADMVIGVIVLSLLYTLPIIGVALYFLATLWAFGKVYTYCKN